MKTYLVGGAVRDRLLDYPVYDRDWLVVGATVEEMQAQGFVPVGKDFPVFLHPKTKEEYALARTERKAGRGYKGFEFFASPDVTLEEDLLRRDLTINAMAEDPDGQIIDPYGGREDLAARRLRHVSPAFSEDPLRVLRVARFAARFAHLGFTIAAETQALMSRIAHSGELQELTRERVWQELERALCEPSPGVFFDCLHRCGALAELMPELDAILAGDLGDSALAALERACALHAPAPTRLAVFCFFAEEASQRLPAMLERLRAPRVFQDAVLLLAELGATLLQRPPLDAEALLILYERLDLSRRPERLAPFLLACRALAGLDEALPFAAGERFQRAVAAIEAVEPRALVAEGFKGKNLGSELRRRRLLTLEEQTLEEAPLKEPARD
ncbi:hypothetical protein [Motiliproteus sp. SC1-56]|uniref:hypothetical protein n=1 Tax=Motiliproteus sp. SC1-56 TaxID=2799565 RepID=UPI001A908351